MKTVSIMIVGVGGQGTLLASRLLGYVLPRKGYDCKISEVHGMSQRGGSVVTYVRFGDKVYSPIVDAGEADFVLSFEQLEAARWLTHLKPDGVIITGTQQILPMPVITGAASYPENIIENLNPTAEVHAVDALSLAEQAGSGKAVNVVLLGVLSKYLPVEREVWMEAIDALVPPKFVEINRKAFELGAGCGE
ncbi:MAG: indolepyruvate oxidoreductase subunit beta [Clostridia bacterium]|nr:indolepyruvate oxidoreductase subunit beta [Clostridia bacterium]